MEGKRFIHKIKLQNFLSYGSEGEEIELQPLNVLIGSNASGKSNLIEAFEILRATHADLPSVFRRGGGIDEFLWKGGKDIPIATIETIIDYPQGINLRYELKFTSNIQRLNIIDEIIENQFPNTYDDIVYYYRYNKGESPELLRGQLYVNPVNLQPNQSILSQKMDSDLYPKLSYLSSEFSKIGLYRNWQIGRYSEPRNAQKADLQQHPMLEDMSNLGLFLNDLKYRIGHRAIIDKLKRFYDSAEEIDVRVYGGTVQIFIREEGMSQPIPATRLSDGTLRYLFLMALLLDPTPPPLICLEEPDIGLHPDILKTVAEMLIEASQRTQLIVTTQSDTLVSALSEYPECVLVCEKDSEGSHLHRLEPDKLKDWLENYTLGDLWSMGEIGGNRW
jgi:predicted ATPase